MYRPPPRMGPERRTPGFPPVRDRRMVVNDAFEVLRKEYDALLEDNKILSEQREGLERQLQAQHADLTGYQRHVQEMDGQMRQMEAQFQEEIAMLRRALSGAGIEPPQIRSKDHNPRPGPPVSRPPTGGEAYNSYGPNGSQNQGPRPQKRIKAEADSKSGNQAPNRNYHIEVNPEFKQTVEVGLGQVMSHSSVVCCVRFSDDGNLLATGCNKSAEIYDVSNGARLGVLPHEGGSLNEDLYTRSVCFSPDSRLLATGAEDMLVRVWDIKENRIVSTLPGHESDIYSIDFYDKDRIISGSGDGTVRIWNLPENRCLDVLRDDFQALQSLPEEEKLKRGITSVSVNKTGDLVAVGSLDWMVRVWDLRTSQLVSKFQGHQNSVYSVSFSPDGRTLASGSLDKTVKVWDISKPGGNCIQSLEGHKDFVLSVGYSPDNNFMISGSKDRTIQFWDVRNYHSMMVVEGHGNSVISVAISKQGKKFASGSGDTTSRIWNYSYI